MATYKLHRWSVRDRDENPYQAPECRTKCLVGFRDSEPKQIRTSHIVEANGREITTSSGSVYILEDMDPDYRAWLEEHDLEFDPENPVQFKKK
jgi:hypothetical protein